MKDDVWLKQLHVGSEHEQVRNVYSGESVELEPIEIAVYDYIKGCEAMRQWHMMDTALDWFRVKNPNAYMVLLD
tara:strand:+ start:748 stop:969 length:222 start_codon:yes stop_codon:yes gene_type:complete